MPATTANLGPGFDCLGMALSLSNLVTVEVIPQGLSIDINGEGHATLSRDEENTIYQCIREVFQKVEMPVPGLHITLENAVPVERGLGSSATAAVGGLTAANRLCGDPLSTDRILALACRWEGHPDNVTPALMGGLTVSVMVDESVVYTRLPVPDLGVVLFVPDFPIPTKKAREVLPEYIPHRDATYNVGRVALLVAALTSGRTDLLPVAVNDRLHEPYRAALFPEITSFYLAAREAGATAAFLSGSGSTILALTIPGNEDNVEQAMRAVARATGVAGRTLVTSINPSGYQYLS